MNSLGETLNNRAIQQMKPPLFKGSPDPPEDEQWILQIKENFKVIDCEEQDCLRLATFMFQGTGGSRRQ